MPGGASSCCCTPAAKIGFDIFPWPGLSAVCFPTTPQISGLAFDISRIDECKLVFAGLFDECSNAMRFTPGQYGTIRTWIEGGGRFYLSAEYTPCLGDSAAVSAFLAAIGSTILYVGGLFDSGCESIAGDRSMIPGLANIAQGLPPIKMAATGQLSGGTNVFRSPSGIHMLQVQKIGNGFLFVCGDSNVAGQQQCLYNNCEFFKRMFNYEDAAII